MRDRRLRFLSREEVRRDLGLAADEVERNTCRACGETIRMMVFRGTEFCSQNCERAPR